MLDNSGPGELSLRAPRATLQRWISDVWQLGDRSTECAQVVAMCASKFAVTGSVRICRDLAGESGRTRGVVMAIYRRRPGLGLHDSDGGAAWRVHEVLARRGRSFLHRMPSCLYICRSASGRTVHVTRSPRELIRSARAARASATVFVLLCAHYRLEVRALMPRKIHLGFSADPVLREDVDQPRWLCASPYKGMKATGTELW